MELMEPSNRKPTQPTPLFSPSLPPYQGVKYNIPVALWVGEGYPAAAPMVYVTPTPSMLIKPGHALVDPSGVVATPYLAAWSGR